MLHKDQRAIFPLSSKLLRGSVVPKLGANHSKIDGLALKSTIPALAHTAFTAQTPQVTGHGIFDWTTNRAKGIANTIEPVWLHACPIARPVNCTHFASTKLHFPYITILSNCTTCNIARVLLPRAPCNQTGSTVLYWDGGTDRFRSFSALQLYI